MRSFAFTALRALSAQVRVPLLVAGADGFSEVLAMRVRTGKAPEIGAIARADARDEKAHPGIGLSPALRAQPVRPRRHHDSRGHRPHHMLHGPVLLPGLVGAPDRAILTQARPQTADLETPRPYDPGMTPDEFRRRRPRG